jgi:hypothetical protein
LALEPGTYFLSPGWIEAGTTLVHEFEQMVQRYGLSRAERVQKEMLKHYKRLAFIDTGAARLERYRRFAQQAARRLGLAYAEITGSRRLLVLMAAGPWQDADFMVLRPGEPVSLRMFLKTGSLLSTG